MFIYVLLASPELNIERVRARVGKGGHAVPEDKIVERYHRSLQQMPWFLEQADISFVYDNSSAEPRLVGEKRDGEILVRPDAPATLLAAVEASGLIYRA